MSDNARPTKNKQAKKRVFDTKQLSMLIVGIISATGGIVCMVIALLHRSPELSQLKYPVIPSYSPSNDIYSNLTGEILDLYKIGAIAKAHDLLLIVDASQTGGCVDINMEEMNIAVLCFTGHKGLYGPQGTGGLCIREGVDIRPFKVGGTEKLFVPGNVKVTFTLTINGDDTLGLSYEEAEEKILEGFLR